MADLQGDGNEWLDLKDLPIIFRGKVWVSVCLACFWPFLLRCCMLPVKSEKKISLMRSETICRKCIDKYLLTVSAVNRSEGAAAL